MNKKWGILRVPVLLLSKSHKDNLKIFNQLMYIFFYDEDGDGGRNDSYN